MSRRFTERFAVRGSSPSQMCTILTRFQNGSSADTLRKCSWTRASTSARASVASWS